MCGISPTSKLGTDEKDNHLYYEINGRKKHAVIFNNVNFTGQDQERKGSDRDCNRMKDCLIKLGFVVNVYKDPKETEIHAAIDQRK